MRKKSHLLEIWGVLVIMWVINITEFCLGSLFQMFRMCFVLLSVSVSSSEHSGLSFRQSLWLPAQCLQRGCRNL